MNQQIRRTRDLIERTPPVGVEQPGSAPRARLREQQRAQSPPDRVRQRLEPVPPPAGTLAQLLSSVTQAKGASDDIREAL